MHDKIRKLLALSRGNANEAEAMAALAKAHKLMAEQGITEDEIREEIRLTIGNLLEENSPGAYLLGLAASDLMGTLFLVNGKTVKFIGRPANVASSEEVFLYLLEQREHFYKAALKQHPGMTQRQRAIFRNDFKATFCEAIARRVKLMLEEYRNAASSSNALVVLTDSRKDEAIAFAQQTMGIRTKAIKGHKVRNAEAAGMGAFSAQQVKLQGELK